MSSTRLKHVVCVWMAALGLTGTAEAQTSRDSWRRDVGCGVELPGLVPKNLPNCEKPLCGDASPIQSTICACLKNDDTGETEINIHRAGGDDRKLATVVSVPFVAESFRIMRGDFEGDGSLQVLLAALNAIGMGMGVEHWSLWVIGAEFLSGPLEVNDFGVMSFPTSSPQGKCKIFAATWREGWEPQRGNGLYIVGQWYDMSGGDLSIDWERPVLYRRYLFSLENQRNEALSATPRSPIPWHKSSATRKVVGPYPGP